MLSKLIKHEISITAKIFVLIYMLTIVVSGILKLFTMLSDNIVADASEGLFVNISPEEEPLIFILQIFVMLIMFFYFALLMTSIASAFVVMIFRFYNNLLGNEGYLMFTLPVTAKEHIITKLITTVLWTIAGIVTCIISSLILFGGELINNIIDTIEFAIMDSNMSIETIVLTTLLIIISYISSCLMIYCSISIGQLQNKHKLLYSVISYIVIYFIIQFIGIILLVVLSFLCNGFFLSPSFDSSLYYTSDMSSLILIITMVINILLCVGFFLITNRNLSKKLNLS